ncbi:MAG: ABC transporter permease [Synergistaceae bacterium]|jgi:peptide/nickel transport system permease protein|nr:ABC transporter permease [Synergistaceae bacterium]
MYRYVIKRLLLIIPILVGVCFIVFFISSLTPGDPATLILGTSAEQSAIDALNHELGYDRPLLVRFARYIYDLIFRLDMGKSYRSQIPVIDVILRRAPTSIIIAFNGMLCACLIGIPLGVLSAVRQYAAVDTLSTTTAMFFAAVPSFWLGMILMYIFSLKLGILPSNGVDSWRHYILPMFAIGLPFAAHQLRFTRSTMLESVRQDYVRTARAKGASERVVIWKHALKNALLPVITITGINFGGLLGGAMITETVYSIPGLGMLLVTSIKTKDIPVVMGTTLFLAVFFCLIMLAVDLMYAFVDPRIKAKYTK